MTLKGVGHSGKSLAADDDVSNEPAKSSCTRPCPAASLLSCVGTQIE